jgi:hypothetical protein
MDRPINELVYLWNNGVIQPLFFLASTHHPGRITLHLYRKLGSYRSCSESVTAACVLVGQLSWVEFETGLRKAGSWELSYLVCCCCCHGDQFLRFWFSNCLEVPGKMSSKLMRIVAAFLAVFALVSTVSAGRLMDVGQNKGYSPKLVERLRKRGTGHAKAKAQPVMERAAVTARAPTATSPCVKLPLNLCLLPTDQTGQAAEATIAPMLSISNLLQVMTISSHSAAHGLLHPLRSSLQSGRQLGQPIALGPQQLPQYNLLLHPKCLRPAAALCQNPQALLEDSDS